MLLVQANFIVTYTLIWSFSAPFTYRYNV